MLTEGPQNVICKQDSKTFCLVPISLGVGHSNYSEWRKTRLLTVQWHLSEFLWARPSSLCCYIGPPCPSRCTPWGSGRVGSSYCRHFLNCQKIHRKTQICGFTDVRSDSMLWHAPNTASTSLEPYDHWCIGLPGFTDGYHTFNTAPEQSPRCPVTQDLARRSFYFYWIYWGVALVNKTVQVFKCTTP